MRAKLPRIDLENLTSQIKICPEIGVVKELNENFKTADDDTIEAVLDQAAKFAYGILEPLNIIGDTEGCQLKDNRVNLPSAAQDYWQNMIEGGWIGLDMPEKYGGQGLPLYLASLVQLIFDRSCPAAGMLPTPNRSATKLLDKFANDHIKSTWLQRLTSGENTASICVSEVDAGSDVNRIRAMGAKINNEIWAITGEKQWISFGDHNLTSNIGHCVLAKTEGSEGISLFFVPNKWENAENNIYVRRIEEKLGLHLSPTCALGFENAKGWLVGEEGRGLSQMFIMITNMRLSVGVQGLAIADGAKDLALQYAKDRKQGGKEKVAKSIIQHKDIQRQLMKMIAEVETLKGLSIALACHIDISNHSNSTEQAAQSRHLAAWLLPLFKTMGGQIGFDTSDAAIQVLGGAGYTNEWPAEQSLRDARVLTIFEGTTGIQALDLLHRRMWGNDQGNGLKSFLETARKEAKGLNGSKRLKVVQSYEILETTAVKLTALKKTPQIAESAATNFLNMAAAASRIWIAARLANSISTTPANKKLAIAGEYAIEELHQQIQGLEKTIAVDMKSSELLEAVLTF